MPLASPSGGPGARTGGYRLPVSEAAQPAPPPLSSPSPVLPTIAPIAWVTPAAVLGSEAAGFTPWLAKNLDLLANALGLDDVELISTETDVSGKRLDILAALGDDGSGTTLGLAIEAQYGSTDHDHLGKLVTYAAGVAATYDRVLCVWLVDVVHPAHEAAIELLNRETSDRLGFILARVRFTQAGPAAFSVDIDVVSQPNEFLRAAQHKAASAHPEREAFLTEVLELARQPLLAAGYSKVSPAGKDGYFANVYWPGTNEWRLHVRVPKQDSDFRAMVYASAHPTTDENAAVLTRLSAHAHLVEGKVADTGAELDWESHLTNKHAKVAALAVCSWPQIGYASDPAEAAERLVHFGLGIAAAAKAAGY